MKLNKVIVKEPNKNLTIENVSKVDLDYLQRKCGNPIDMYELDEGVDIVFNDEMLLSEEYEPNFCLFVDDRLQPFHGTVVFSGVDSSGDSIGLTDEQIRVIIECFSYTE